MDDTTTAFLDLRGVLDAGKEVQKLQKKRVEARAVSGPELPAEPRCQTGCSGFATGEACAAQPLSGSLIHRYIALPANVKPISVDRLRRPLEGQHRIAVYVTNQVHNLVSFACGHGCGADKSPSSCQVESRREKVVARMSASGYAANSPDAVKADDKEKLAKLDAELATVMQNLQEFQAQLQ